MNHFAKTRDAILMQRFGVPTPVLDEPTKPYTYNEDFETLEIPVVGEDIEYGNLKETKESKDERLGS